MNWAAVGAIGDVVGSIGVIASLVYLATQIGISAAQTEQNSKPVRGTAFQQFRIPIADPQLA